MNRLRELRKKKNKTIVELSQETGIAKSTIARYETDSTISLKSELAKVLADYFGVSIDYLLCIDVNPQIDKDVSFAFFQQKGIVTEQQQKEIEQFIEFIKKRDEQKWK